MSIGAWKKFLLHIKYGIHFITPGTNMVTFLLAVDPFLQQKMLLATVSSLRSPSPYSLQIAICSNPSGSFYANLTNILFHSHLRLTKFPVTFTL